MNQNHHHPPEDEDRRLRKVERSIDEGRASGDPLIDQLAGMQPQANQAFREGLEAHLLDNYFSDEQPEKDEETMTTFYPTERTLPQTSRFSLTLAAAVVVLLIVGAFAAIMFNAPVQGPNSAAPIILQDATETPEPNVITSTPSSPPTETPEPTVITSTPTYTPTTVPSRTMIPPPTPSVYIVEPGDTLLRIVNKVGYGADLIPEILLFNGLNDPNSLQVGQELLIPREIRVMVVVVVQSIPEGEVIAPNMLKMMRWPATDLPLGTFTDPQQIIGRIAGTQISPEMPVTANLLKPETAPRVQLVAIPRSGLSDRVEVGDRVTVSDLVSSLSYDNIQGALVVYVGSMPEDEHPFQPINSVLNNDEEVVVLAVTSEQARIITAWLEAGRFLGIN